MLLLYLLVDVIPSADVFANFLFGQPPFLSEEFGNFFRLISSKNIVLNQQLNSFFGVVIELSDASNEQVFKWVTSSLVFSHHPVVNCVERLQQVKQNNSLA